MSKNLILVAGYPKSGSTWVRLMLEALARPRDHRISINELGNGFYGGWRRLLFDGIAPANAASLLPEEVDALLPGVYRRLSAEAGRPVLVKVHDICFRTRLGEWLYPPDCVRSVVYLVRHPFDVTVSFAHHLGLDLEKTVRILNLDHVMAPAGPRLVFPLHERIGSWSDNVSSWLDDAPYPLTLVRYEDLHSDPSAAFAGVATAVGFNTDRESIRRAIESLSFEQLRTEEQAHGFGERPRSSPSFFRAGRPRSWEGKLGVGLQNQLVRDHGSMMNRLGYTADGHAQPLAAGQ
jgi:hypothetical protein